MNQRKINKFLFLIVAVFVFSSCDSIHHSNLIQKAETLNHEGKFKEALLVYDEIKLRFPHDEGAYIMSGHIFNKIKQPQKAIDQFEQAQKINADNPWIYAGIANSNRKLGNFDEALGNINKSIDLKPNSSTLLFSRSQILQFLERHEDAIIDLKKVRKEEPHRVDVLNGLVVSYTATSEFNKATQLFHELIIIDPSNCETLRNWAHLNYKTNNKTTSCEYVIKAKQFCTFHKSIDLLNKIQEEVCY